MLVHKVFFVVLGLALGSALPRRQSFNTKSLSLPEDAPSWWPEDRPWPPQHPESIPWPPQHPEWIPWPPQHPEWIPLPPEHPEWIPWPPQHPEWIPWPPTHPEGIPWPPTHPEGIPWPPTIPDWLPWPPTHPEWIPWPPTHPEWIPWPPTHPEWIPWPPSYVPSRDNQFHLFTRANPSVSQPILHENAGTLAGTNFDASRKTVIIIHDIKESAGSGSTAILVPAILQASDANVILVDWSGGATSTPALSSLYAHLSGNFVAEFVSWLTTSSGTDLADLHLIGVGVGAFSAAFVGKRLDNQVGYVTALDPASGPYVTNILPPINLKAAHYTEVIHTDAGTTGYLPPLGDVDFYPNGGRNMPGCGGDSECNRLRAVYYFAESVQNGGFTGTQCENHFDALNEDCNSESKLNMGGLTPKVGSSGVYYLQTNSLPPFSLG